MKWYFKVLRNYGVFSGRARRKEYWIFGLFHTIIYLLLAGFALASGFEQFTVVSGQSIIVSSIVVIYFFVTLIPSFAVLVRRLHDVGHSGWMILICLIPFIGGLVLFIFVLQNSQSGENQYGKNPKTNG